MRILITGGAGYIGSHTLVAVLAAGHEAHVIDNLSNGSEAALARVRQITNRAPGFTRADIRDPAAVAAVVAEAAPEAVIHFAGLKAVGESVSRPLAYFDNNVGGTLALLAALQASPCRRFVFSSSATVYGDPDYLPIDEAHPRRTTNPYGRSKLQIEGILEDLAASDPPGRSRSCATSTRSARMPRGGSARIRPAFRTTSCPSSPRWRWGGGRGCRCSGATTRRPTAPACATTST
jgi:UDP-glucose 4-epimerase